MTMVSPAAIHGIYVAVKALIPQAVFLGIAGDARHVADGGYHISRSLLLSDGMGRDYSIQHAADKLGKADNSSAIDIGFGYGTPLMKAVTQRLLAAGRAWDPRMGAVREFYGCGPSSSTTDVVGWDFVAHQGASTSDYSHRGHIHLSIIREFSDSPAALAGIADVIAGVPLVKELTMDDEAKKAFADLNARLDTFFSVPDGKGGSKPAHRLVTWLKAFGLKQTSDPDAAK